jgi:hypothetical protein
MSTQTIERTDTKPSTGSPECAHIVKDKNKVSDAYLNGTPVEALCGHVFVPTKDPKKLPVCQMCKELADAFLKGGNSDDIT